MLKSYFCVFSRLFSTFSSPSFDISSSFSSLYRNIWNVEMLLVLLQKEILNGKKTLKSPLKGNFCVKIAKQHFSLLYFCIMYEIVIICVGTRQGTQKTILLLRLLRFFPYLLSVHLHCNGAQCKCISIIVDNGNETKI